MLSVLEDGVDITNSVTISYDTSGNTQIKHALEWNFFLGIIFFYFLTFLMWKKN